MGPKSSKGYSAVEVESHKGSSKAPVVEVKDNKNFINNERQPEVKTNDKNYYTVPKNKIEIKSWADAKTVKDKEESLPKLRGDDSLACQIIEKYGDPSDDAITPECLAGFGESISINVEQDVLLVLELGGNSSSLLSL